MSEETCLLTLVLPPRLEENVIGLLLENPAWAARFAVFRVEGHGQAVPLSGSAELVRGRSPRLMVQLVISAAHEQALLAKLRETVPSPDVAYWSVALRAMGRLA